MGTLNVVGTSGHSDVGAGSRQSVLASACTDLASAEIAKEESRSIQITTYYSWASIAEIIPAWEGILAENPTLTIFSTPEWLRSWWEAFGSGRQLVTLAFHNASGTLLGLIPLYWETSKNPFFGVKELRLVGDGSGDSDNLDLIVRPDTQEVCVSAFIRWMTQQRKGGLCSLNTLPTNSMAYRSLAIRLEQANWHLRQTTTPNASISMPDSWESYTGSLSPKFRRLITRSRRKLESHYTVQFRRIQNAAELPEALETLYALHQKRWISAREPGSFASLERKDFYARVSQAFLRRDWLELWFLELNGRAVAAQFSFRYRDTVYGLQEGFDTDFAPEHVGYVLRAAMLEQFIQSGIKRYDFLGGFNQQKQKWGAELGIYVNLQFAAPWSFASCYLALDRHAATSKEWLRHHLPSSAWSVLHRVKRMVKEEGRNSQIQPNSAVSNRADETATATVTGE